MDRNIVSEVENIEKGFNAFIVEKLNEKKEQKISTGYYLDEDAYLTALLSINNPSASEASALKNLYYRPSGYITKSSNRIIEFDESIILKSMEVSQKDLIDFYGGFSAIASMNKSFEELDLSLILRVNSVEITSFPNAVVKASYVGTKDAFSFHKIKDETIYFDIVFDDIDYNFLLIRDLAQDYPRVFEQELYILNELWNHGYQKMHPIDLNLPFSANSTENSKLLSPLKLSLRQFLTSKGTGLFNSGYTFSDMDQIISKAKNDLNILELIVENYITDDTYYNSDFFKEYEILTLNDCSNLKSFDDSPSIYDHYENYLVYLKNYQDMLNNPNVALAIDIDAPYEEKEIEGKVYRKHVKNNYPYRDYSKSSRDFYYKHNERHKFGETIQINIESILKNNKITKEQDSKKSRKNLVG